VYTDYFRCIKSNLGILFKNFNVKSFGHLVLSRLNKMAEYLQKQPKKSILKNSSSFDGEKRRESKPSMKFDEMNIIATHHPADKDYGHMKIDEPKTPYNYRDGSSDELDSILDPSELAHKLESGREAGPRALVTPPLVEEEEEDEGLTEQEREEKRKFALRRKEHYNEFMAVKLARELMARDEEEDEDEEEGEKGAETMDVEEGAGAC